MKPRPATAGDLKVSTPKTSNDNEGKDSNKAVIFAVGVLLLSNVGLILYTINLRRRFTVQITEAQAKNKKAVVVKDNQKNHKIINS